MNRMNRRHAEFSVWSRKFNAVGGPGMCARLGSPDRRLLTWYWTKYIFVVRYGIKFYSFYSENTVSSTFSFNVSPCGSDLWWWIPFYISERYLKMLYLSLLSLRWIFFCIGSRSFRFHDLPFWSWTSSYLRNRLLSISRHCMDETSLSSECQIGG